MSPGDISLGKLRKLVEIRYDGNASAAAKAWELEQSHLSRILKGERGIKASLADRIARKEKINLADLRDLTPGRAGIAAVEPEKPMGRFKYSVDDPIGMLMQVQNWFAETPNTNQMKDRAVKAVMRVLMDCSFDEIHRPSVQWRAMFEHLEGWGARIRQDKPNSGVQR